MQTRSVKITVIFIVFMFAMTSFSVMAYSSEHIRARGNSTNGTFKPTSSSNKGSAEPYVKYSLVLTNNTLVNGNFLNFSTVIDTVSVGSNPFGAAFDSSNGYVYVTNFGSNNISVINGATNAVVDTVSVGSDPVGAAFDSSNGYVYVTNGNSNNVLIINGTTNNIVKNITGGSFPAAAAFDSSNGYVYVTNARSNNVLVINGATNAVVDTVSVGLEPCGVTFDSSNGYVYVTNLGSGSVSIIPTTNQSVSEYSLTFTETGLPSGTSWSVTFNGSTESSTTSTMTISVPNGSYSYTVSSVAGYTVLPSSGSVTVNGSNVSVAITFTLVKTTVSKYIITFTETGLPSGTSWSITLNGTTESSTTGTIAFTEPNGSYSYTVGTVTGYTPFPPSSTINVSGDPVSTNIIFTSIKHAHYLLYDNFVSDNYINTTRWSLDSSVLQNITQTDSKLFGENITLVQPNDFAYSFNGGLSFLPSGYDNMAGFTGNRLFTYPITVNVNFTLGSDQGGNSMIILSNSKGYDIAGVYLADQAYVQSGNQTPEATGYSIQIGVEYDLSMYVNSTQFTVTINSSQARYSEMYQYSPSGNQTLYLTFGSFIGTFPGELYSPTHTPEIVYQTVSVDSESTWSLSVYTNSSNGNPDSGVNVTIINAFTNRTETAISSPNGTARFNNLYSGQYYVVSSQTQGGVQVTNSRYIFVGEPNDPSHSNISLSLEISAPPPPQLCASIESMNSTSGQAPWNNTFIALPGGYVGNYTYSWYVNGVYAGNGIELSRTFYNPSSVGTTSYKVSLQVTSQGKWFGVTYSPIVADALTYQIVYSKPIYLSLSVTSPEAYASVSYDNHYDFALGFLKGQTLYLDANITDNYLSDTIPQWLMGIIGISYPFWGVNISNSAGNDNGIFQVLQPGSAAYLNNVSLPGIITSLNQLDGSAFDVTMNPVAMFAVIGDVIQVVLSAIGVIGGLSVIASSSYSIIPPLIDDLIMQLDHSSVLNSFKLLSGSSVNIVGAITDGITSFLEDLLPTIPHILYSIVRQSAPEDLDAISGLIGDLGGTISKIFPAWKLFDLGFDIGAVLGAAIRGNLVTQYRITGYQNSITYTVNDPGDALPYVQVSDASGYSGWNGSWVGNGYSHSSFTPSGYAFSLPSNGTSTLEITNPSRTSSIQYDLNVSVDNITENLKGTLNLGSTVKYVVSSNATYVSIAKEYAVSFVEDGLPSGTSWSVTFNGTSETSSTNTITFVVPNGTYSFSIGSVSGYTVNESSGSLTVGGSNVSKTITFSSTTNTNPISPFRGLSDLDIYAIIGAVILVLVIGSAVALNRRKK